MWVDGQRHAPVALPLEKTECPLCTEQNGPQDRSGRMRNISPPQGFDPRTVQLIASRYTDWAIPAQLYPIPLHNGHIPFSQSLQQLQPNSVLPKQGGNTFFRSIRTNCLSKQRKNSPWSWPLLCIRLLLCSILNTKTGYPDFGVSVVVY